LIHVDSCNAMPKEAGEEARRKLGRLGNGPRLEALKPNQGSVLNSKPFSTFVCLELSGRFLSHYNRMPHW
jgi:hypothetical protein